MEATEEKLSGTKQHNCPQVVKNIFWCRSRALHQIPREMQNSVQGAMWRVRALFQSIDNDLDVVFSQDETQDQPSSALARTNTSLPPLHINTAVNESRMFRPAAPRNSEQKFPLMK